MEFETISRLVTSFAALLILVSCSSTEPIPDTNWGKWGAEDQIGTLNYITPGVTVQAAGVVESGHVYSLAIPLTDYQPARGPRIQHFMLSTAQGTDSRPHWIGDSLSLPTHGTTHWDGLGHVFGEGQLYNGHDARTNLTSAGALKNGVHLAADSLVSRGVLLDVARYKQVERLPAGYVITGEDLQATARQQNLLLRRGDVVLIRTGWLSQFLGENAEPFWSFSWTEDQVRDEPGIGWEVSQWLKEIEAAAVAVDNLSVEAVPTEAGAGERTGLPEFDWPVHYELIRNQGMMLGALFQLDELAAACARDGRYDFLFVGPPYRLTHGTGSPVNPLAIR